MIPLFITFFSFSLNTVVVRSGPLKWYDSNFRKQNHIVSFSSASDVKQIASGVPQGSIRGPLLSLVCIDCIANAVSKSISVCFVADDMTIILPLVSNALSLHSWSVTYRLSVIFSKTSLVAFRRKPLPYIDVSLAGNISFLGLRISKSLKWISHFLTL